MILSDPSRQKPFLSRVQSLLLLTTLCFSLTACASSEPYVTLKGHKIQVEVVTTLEKQALGLMYRTAMATDHGMLFVYKQPAQMSFWMKNTRIPLDILYFDQNLELINISADTPPCTTPICPAYPSAGPAQYVLEINAGLAAQWQLEKNEKLSLYLN